MFVYCFRIDGLCARAMSLYERTMNRIKRTDMFNVHLLGCDLLRCSQPWMTTYNWASFAGWHTFLAKPTATHFFYCCVASISLAVYCVARTHTSIQPFSHLHNFGYITVEMLTKTNFSETDNIIVMQWNHSPPARLRCCRQLTTPRPARRANDQSFLFYYFISMVFFVSFSCLPLLSTVIWIYVLYVAMIRWWMNQWQPGAIRPRMPLSCLPVGRIFFCLQSRTFHGSLNNNE